MPSNLLLHFGLPEPIRQQIVVINNRKYISELAYDVSLLIQVVSVGISKFNHDQKKVYDDILNSVDFNSGQLFSWRNKENIIDPSSAF
ncbi:hypothetical protein NPIL_496901 [Nephila pilipes]|uniref:Uncharacterized protein n=1 Tax=Nephila pilipes TaxID=299642 RepID=A0A8X6NME8_NEPPI|nr:hypothetical protein NPIL_496901 [Nephila pilipes]